MNKKAKVLISLISMIVVPTLVFADGDNSYNAISSILKALLNVIQWFGYAIAVRNYDLDGHKICYEWCK